MKLNYFVGHRGPLQVAGETRQPGAPCPEAAEWPNLAVYLQNGHVVAFPEGAQPVVVVPASAPAPVQTNPGGQNPSTDGHEGAETLPATLADLTVAQAEPLILKVDDAATLAAWLEAETAGENRKGIVVPLTTKLDDLTKPAE